MEAVLYGALADRIFPRYYLTGFFRILDFPFELSFLYEIQNFREYRARFITHFDKLPPAEERLGFYLLVLELVELCHYEIIGLGRAVAREAIREMEDHVLLEIGLPDNYTLPPAALFQFGFGYDPDFIQSTGARMWKGLALAEDRVRQQAAAAGLSVFQYRKQLQKNYRELIASSPGGVSGEENN